MTILCLSELFTAGSGTESFQLTDAKRSIIISEQSNIILDQFNTQVQSAFIRIADREKFTLTIDGQYTFKRISSSSYLGTPEASNLPSYWLASSPILRTFNQDQSIINEQEVDFDSLSWNQKHCTLEIQCPKQTTLDFVVWQFSDNATASQLTSLSAIEQQGYFLWGSHGCLKRPSDLYRHLIHGAVYDLRYAWPHKKKCPSENEAHALYVIFSGLEKNTGKSIYRFFQLQIVLSIIQRQAEDGGWYHGIWTDASECHYRLHTSALHLLMDEYQRDACPAVAKALQRGIAFLSKNTDTLDCGTWFLHDSLELSDASMNSGPFKWIADKTLGKSISNMLVLNTHLDSTIALNRYQAITGDTQYTDLILSALASTRAVLALKTADWLYLPLFWAIGLTMLPTEKASQLPIHIRAVKRFAWQYLIKKLPDIKARLPRLVMPNGYIDRELSLRTWSVDYQTINLMDLARHAYAFPDAFNDGILDKALAYTQACGLIKRYRELTPGKRYSVGFWVEALYYRCLTKSDLSYRAWLAEAMQECHDLNFGIPPSLLGTNGEAIERSKTTARVNTNNEELLVANLAHAQHIEFLILNTAATNITIDWGFAPPENMLWYQDGIQLIQEKVLTIPAKSWIIGKARIQCPITLADKHQISRSLCI